MGNFAQNQGKNDQFPARTEGACGFLEVPMASPNWPKSAQKRLKNAAVTKEREFTSEGGREKEHGENHRHGG